jgi:hypothetical protein
MNARITPASASCRTADRGDRTNACRGSSAVAMPATGHRIRPVRSPPALPESSSYARAVPPAEEPPGGMVRVHMYEVCWPPLT